MNFATCSYSFHRYFSVTISLVVTFFHMRFFQNFTQVSGNSKNYLVTLKGILFYPRKSTWCKKASCYLFFLPAAYMWQNAKIYLWHLVRSTNSNFDKFRRHRQQSNNNSKGGVEDKLSKTNGRELLLKPTGGKLKKISCQC